MHIQSVARLTVFVVGLMGLILTLGSPVQAENLGVFSWRIAPFCNVFLFQISADSNVAALHGFDDNCGAVNVRPAHGAGVVRSDGLLTLQWDTLGVTFLGLVGISNLSGTWVNNNGGQTGSLQFVGVTSNAAHGAAGTTRPEAPPEGPPYPYPWGAQ